MAVAGYKVRVDGTTVIDAGNVLTYDVDGLGTETEHSFEVLAYDDAGNESAYCDIVMATTFGAPINVALASNGSTATASSETTGSGFFQPSRTIDGYRNTNSLWGSATTPGGGWNSVGNPSSGSPEWLQVAFSGSKTISEIDVFTLADAINYNTDPTLTDTFTSYGIVDFKTQYWNGSAWVDINTVTGNNKVWRQFTFSPISTTKIRVLITAALGGNARLVEVEAWGN